MYVYRLDPALIRPGRIDVKEYVGYCSQYQVEQMFKRFFNTPNNIEKAQAFAAKVMSFGKNVSPAQIQGYFMMHKMSNTDEVIANVADIWEDVRKAKVVESNSIKVKQ